MVLVLYRRSIMGLIFEGRAVRRDPFVGLYVVMLKVCCGLVKSSPITSHVFWYKKFYCKALFFKAFLLLGSVKTYNKPDAALNCSIVAKPCAELFHCCRCD